MKKLLFLLLTPLLVDCATLDVLPESTCGNGVVDVNEDCDSFPVGSRTQACGTTGANACRLVCGKQPNGDTDVCPDGWGCSVDGICRQPTGAFDGAAEPVSAGVTTMLVGDFDGDGRKDVLGSSAAISKGRIHYFKDGAAPDVVPLPSVLAAPLVYDFDGDGRSDIAFGYTFRGATEVDGGILQLDASGGFAIIQGQTDRAVVAKLFPTITVPQFDALLVPLRIDVAKDVPAAATANPVIAFATGKIAGVTVTLLRSVDVDPSDVTKGYFKTITTNADDVASPPIATSMFDSVATSTCGEVVVPLKTGVQVYSPCVRGPGGNVSWSKADPVTFPFPGETVTRVFSADVDGKGHADLIVGTTAADGPHVHVGYSDGTTLTFAAAPDTLIDVPLAAGYLDSDKRIDFVVPAGVLFSTNMTLSATIDAGADAGAEAPLAWTLVPGPTKKWTVAAIADVNRDTIPDVIAASMYEPDIDVLEGTLSLNMPPFSIQTSGAVTNLGIGDFDFDFTSDIAFVQAPAASTQREVAIAYGRALTMPPEAPRTAGRLDGIRQVFPSATGLSIASSANVAGGLPTFSFAVLLSSADRQPVAPLFFSDVNDPVANPGITRRELITRSLVAASNGTAVDLVGIVGKQDYRRATGAAVGPPAYQLWSAKGTGPDAFAPPVENVELTGLIAVDKDTDLFLVQTAAADLDGDGKTELVVIAPDASGTGVTFRVVRPGTTALPTANPVPGKAPAAGERAQLLDVDADGALDLVTILVDTQSKARAVNVLFGDGKGGFSSAPLMLTLPDDALDFTRLTTGGAGALSGGQKRTELVIITSAHLYRVQIGQGRTPEIVDATTLFGSIGSGSAVVSGDFDGDGVEDLAIADQGSIRIARQQPRLR